MTKKHSTRPAAEAWVESHPHFKLTINQNSYTKDTERHMTVYLDKITRRTIARVTLWSESVWLARIN